MQVKGTFGKIGGVVAITSLAFITSKGTFGPFGSPRGQQFQSYPYGKVVGFYGKASAFVVEFGVITKLCAGNVSEVAAQTICHVGPWGGVGGKPFHDGQGHIREINVRHCPSHVVSLQVAYVHGDSMMLNASKHGDSSEGSHVKVSLEKSVSYFASYFQCCCYVTSKWLISFPSF